METKPIIKKELQETEDSLEHSDRCMPLINDIPKDVLVESTNIKTEATDQYSNNIDIQKATINCISVKNEFDTNNSYTYCDVCKTKYHLFCSNCPMLSYILESTADNKNCGSNITGTFPKHLLKTEFSLTREEGVFTLISIPENVKFGPYKNLECITNLTGCNFKLNNGKLVNNDTTNWMQYVNRTVDIQIANLSAFQSNGSIFYQSRKPINIGEQLLVYYEEEFIHNFDNYNGEFFTPPVKKKLEKYYACEPCCLGFSTKVYLNQHLKDCQHKIVRNSSSPTRNKCHPHEGESSDRASKTYSRKPSLPTASTNKTSTRKKYICATCSYETSHRNTFVCHQNMHAGIKQFECEICNQRFTQKQNLKVHLSLKHINVENKLYGCKPSAPTASTNKTSTRKKYICETCPYETSHKNTFVRHQNMHAGIKQFQCEICSQRFTQKQHLKLHQSLKHINVENKLYQCTKCTYQTNLRASLRYHQYIHDEVKPYQCDTCQRQFTRKRSLTLHFKNEHTLNPKEYKCPKCNYATNAKRNFRRHQALHANVNSFVCELCKKMFKHKDEYIGDEKVLKCRKCTYETNNKVYLVRRIQRQKYECGICNIKFISDKNLKNHISKHNVIPQCKLCGKTFNSKSTLSRHVKNMHFEPLNKDVQI